MLKMNHALIATLMAWSMVFAVSAQEKKSADVKVQNNSAVKAEVKTDRKSIQTMLHRATELNGMKVRNSANKDLGSIKDTVIDVHSGEIAYAALSSGGFLGLGDKIFAVPWDVLQHRHNVSSADAYFVLDVDEATLKRSPGFDDSKWPDFADRQFSSKIDTFYEKYRRQSSSGTAATDARVAVDVKKNDAKTSTSQQRMMLRSSAIMGMKVKNEAQKDLGKVHDLVIEVNPGKVRYAALSYGGILGLGDKLFAVPWKAFTLRHDISDKEFSLVINVDEARLRKATGFDSDKWPNFADPTITSELDKYYGVHGDRAATGGTTGGAIVREPKDR